MNKLYKTSATIPQSIKDKAFYHPQERHSISISVTHLDGYKLPGIIDCHFHGAYGWDFSFGDPEKINAMLDKCLPEGLTGVIATLMISSEENTEKAIRDITEVIEKRTVPPFVHGIYLEGPFLASAKSHQHQREFLLSPDIELIKKWQDIAKGKIKIVTVAPELEGATDFIEEASQMGIICSIGHTQATWAQTKAAIKAGAKHVTHCFNAMNPLYHRDPGALGCILADKTLTLELISDSIHLAPETVAMIYSIHESDKIVLVSDSIAPRGMSDGKHDFYGTTLLKKDGKITYAASGAIAGGNSSLLTATVRTAKDAGTSWGSLGTAIWRTPSRILNLKSLETNVYFDKDFNWLATSLNNKTWFHK
ncbi:MAG: N-acetylglucosamine-6-phosphate deacetylase [Candidatus Riflebacteria bacterium]|nr:N-acetylglucosamine-6-phosphate deacetylase [Candidatus Riflebacteria bacterium]